MKKKLKNYKLKIIT